MASCPLKQVLTLCLKLTPKMKIMMTRFLFLLTITIYSILSLSAQEEVKPIAKQILKNKAIFDQLKSTTLHSPIPGGELRTPVLGTEIKEGVFFRPRERAITELRSAAPDFTVINLPLNPGYAVNLELFKSDVITNDFAVTLASDPENPAIVDVPTHYWGIVNGDIESLAAISIFKDEIAGIIMYQGKTYNLGKVESEAGIHVLYEAQDMLFELPFECGTDISKHSFGHRGNQDNRASNPANVVRMYIEIDNDLVVNKGGATNAVNYVLAAFSQVSLLYANDQVNLAVNQVVAWDVADPYTGPSTSDYLTQLRTRLNGNFNGDLAHLVGSQGGGGIAYLDVLCYKPYGVGYSMIYNSFSNVPTYSWTIEVLTHEIGHNLGSNHTHDCVWNGNNTPIDCCGQNAGYPSGSCGSGYTCNIANPSTGGTIMSYCHLTSAGINFNHGFGPQPKAKIQSVVYNAACLSPYTRDAAITEISSPAAFPCEQIINPTVTLKNYGNGNLTSVKINYRIDDQNALIYTWTGSLISNSMVNVTLPAITLPGGAHSFTAWTSLPNDASDENTSNDEQTVNFNYIPDYCNCTAETTNFNSTSLFRSSGTGSVSTTKMLIPGSKKVGFTISGLNAVLSGNSSKRYTERVIITYKDMSGNIQTYGTFSGNTTSTVNVYITSPIREVTIVLSNSQATSYSGQLSVNLSVIDYCRPNCNGDADNDGFCDEYDVCAAFNDQMLGTACNDQNDCTINDIYTGCNVCKGTPVTYNFNVNTLTHRGTGSKFTTLTFPNTMTSGIVFTISDINANTTTTTIKNRFIDRVTISYVDGDNVSKQFVVLNGTSVNRSEAIQINDDIKSVTVSLTDGYDGSSAVTQSISLSAVTCNSGTMPESIQENPLPESLNYEMTLYPNPAQDQFTVSLDYPVNHADIIIFNSLGSEIYRTNMTETRSKVVSLNGYISGPQILYVMMVPRDQKPVTQKLIIIE